MGLGSGARSEVAQLCKLRAGACCFWDGSEWMLQAVRDGEGGGGKIRFRMGRGVAGRFGGGGVWWDARSTQLAKLRYFAGAWGGGLEVASVESGWGGPP